MSFVNSFISYMMVVLVFAAVAVGAAMLGIILRKRKDAKQED